MRVHVFDSGLQFTRELRARVDLWPTPAVCGPIVFFLVQPNPQDRRKSVRGRGLDRRHAADGHGCFAFKTHSLGYVVDQTWQLSS